MTNKNRRRSFEIAISGISAALALISLTLARFVPNMTLTFYALSSIALSLPLLAGSIFGYFGAYAISSLLSFLLYSYIFASPYILFFGLHTLTWYIIKKYPKIRFVSIPIKAGYTVGIFFALLRICGIDFFALPLFSTLGIEPQWWYIVLILIVLAVAYDFLMQFVYKYLGIRLSGILEKYKTKTDKAKKIVNGDEATQDASSDNVSAYGKETDSDAIDDGEKESADNSDDFFD